MADVLVTLDVYPVRARLPHGGTIEPARAIVADGELTVWVSRSGIPAAHFVRRVLSTEGSRMAGYSIQVEDGSVLVTRSSGCGCGDTLRFFDPFAEARTVIEGTA